MTTKEGKYYLYRHIRIDKNEPFYIGIGSKNGKNNKSIITEYSRAYTKRGRNKIWSSIVDRTDYEIEIILETDDKNFVEQKEKEFIELHGRLVLSNGTLSNLHKGGNYKDGHKLSEEQRMNISNRQKGEKHHNALKVYNKKTKNIFNSVSETAKFFNIDGGSISNMLKGEAKNELNIMYYEDYLKGDYRAFSFLDKTYTPVINYKTLDIFNTITEAAESINMDANKLAEYLRGKKCTNKTDFIKVSDYNNGMTPLTIFKGNKRDMLVYNVKTKVIYNSVKEASEKESITAYSLYHKLNGDTVNDTNLIYKRDYDKGLLPKDLKVDGKKKPLIDKITKKEFDSIKMASEYYNIPQKQLSRYLNPNNSIENKTNLEYLK